MHLTLSSQLISEILSNLAHEFSREHLHFYKLSFDFAFPTSVSWREDLT